MCFTEMLGCFCNIQIKIKDVMTVDYYIIHKFPLFHTFDKTNE